MYRAGKCLNSSSASSSWCSFPCGSSSLSITALWYLGWPLKERYSVKVISLRHCLQKWHQTKNVENVLIFPGLLCLCVIVHLLHKAVVLKMEMLFGQKKRKKMLMFCSLALLVKFKLCGGNLCKSGFFLHCGSPSLQHCGDRCPTDLTAELLPSLIVLQDETHARKTADCFFCNLHIFLALQVPFLLLLPGDF